MCLNKSGIPKRMAVVHHLNKVDTELLLVSHVKTKMLKKDLRKVFWKSMRGFHDIYEEFQSYVEKCFSLEYIRLFLEYWEVALNFFRTNS